MLRGRRKKVGLRYKNLQTMLDSLRLAYKEHDRDKSSYRVDVPLFGIRIRLEGYTAPPNMDAGWDVIPVSHEVLNDKPEELRDPLLWSLVSKGYLAYIRESDRGAGGRIFRAIVIDGGWGQRIIEKRIELCGDEPKHSFMKIRMEEFLKVSMPRIISHYPGFFDYLI